MADDRTTQPAERDPPPTPLERIFEEALALPAEARDAFLRGACDGDAALLERARRMVRAAGSDDVPDVLAFGHGLPGRIGDWQPIGRLGQGGMGEVLLVRRVGPDFVQLGAMKLLRTDGGSEELRRRLRRERQVLARLRHPNIARLIDGGEAADGTPYLVMEHVPGEPIDRWCDRRSLDVRARVRLFLGVCEAVSAAHRALVVHRDLKPSNVLVDDDGQPKLLDFGIAHLLDPSGEAAWTAPAMTPRYASPEQIEGGAISTATDVYSLGVMLYELLSGRHPFHESTGNSGALQRAILDASPPSLAAAATLDAADASAVERAALRELSPDRLRKALSGDLETIVAKALHRDPERRYASVDALADDLRRHLDGLPVLARPDSFGYRFGRLLRRNPIASGAAIAALLVASVAIGFIVVALRAELAARVETRRQLDASQAVVDFLTEDILGAADPVRGADGERSIRELLDAAAADVGTRFADRPDIASVVHGVLGQAYRRLDRREDAERELRLGLEAAGSSRDPAALLARRELAILAASRGERDAAASALAEVAADAAATLGEDSELRLSTLSSLGEVLLDLARYPEAIAVLSDATERSTRTRGADDALTISIEGNLARTLLAAGRIDEAEAAMRRLLDLSRSRWGPDHPESIAHANNLGLLLIGEDRLEEAEGLYIDAAASSERSFGPLHSATLTIKSNVVLLRFRRREFAAAEPLAREVLAARLEAFGPDHPDTLLSRNFTGLIALNLGRHEEAVAELTDVHDRRAAALGPDHPHTLNSLYNIGMAAAMGGDDAQARRLIEDVARRRDATLGPTHPESLAAWMQAATIAERSGDRESARRMLGAAHDRVVADRGSDDAAAIRLRERIDLLDRPRPPGGEPAMD